MFRAITCFCNCISCPKFARCFKRLFRLIVELIVNQFGVKMFIIVFFSHWPWLFPNGMTTLELYTADLLFFNFMYVVVQFAAIYFN